MAPAPALTVTTIKKRAEFLRLNRARKSVTPYFILRSAAMEQPHPTGCRVGYTVTTKCGNAVQRNRIKRRLRALVRTVFPQHAHAGMDYVFIALAQAQPSLADAPFTEIEAAMLRALAHAHAPLRTPA